MRDNPLSGTDPDGHDPGTAAMTWEQVLDLMEEGAEAAGPEGLLAAGSFALGVYAIEHSGGNYSTPGPYVGPIFSKGQSGEPPQLKAGKDAHNNEEVRPGEQKEVPTASKKGRMDRYDADKGHIREIKPDNARGRKEGQKQLDRYKADQEQATRKPHTTELTTYPPKTHQKTQQ